LQLQTAALEATANAIAITDRAGAISWVNPAFTRSTGYALDEAVGQNLRVLKSGKHDQSFYRDLWETILAGRVWQGELINRRKDGKLSPHETTITPVRGAGGEITHFVGVKQDISERKRMAEALRESDGRYRSLFENMLEGFAYCRMRFEDDQPQDFEFLEVNSAFEKLTGLKDVVGRRATEVVPGIKDSHPELFEVFGRVALTGRPERFESYLKPLKAWLSVYVYGSAKGCFIAVFDNVTERRELEIQLRQAQKMEAIGQLAGGVAHDFNNMLAVIRGNAELVLMDSDQLSAQARECLKHITSASDKAAGLTRQLLTFSRKQVMQAQPLNLNDVIGSVTKMLNRIIREDVQLQCAYGTKQAFVQADVGMLEQVLVNLVVNARDAMPHGGPLVITTDRTTLDEGYARSNSEGRTGQFVTLCVRDMGTGIAPEVLPRIFEPFFTTKDPGKGTGLGLATVYGIVKQHQGWIEVSSRIGEGSSFKVFLPAIEAPSGATEAKAEETLRGGSETVLVVEDDPAVRLQTRHMLERFGYLVKEASSGREGLEVWEGHGANVDLVLTDMVMPGGMTGREMVERLWGQEPGLKVIFTSGYDRENAGRDTDFIRRSKSRFLQKPCSSRQLIETVRQSLDEKWESPRTMATPPS
jgi:PAS domain S-box-containing protein